MYGYRTFYFFFLFIVALVILPVCTNWLRGPAWTRGRAEERFRSDFYRYFRARSVKRFDPRGRTVFFAETSRLLTSRRLESIDPEPYPARGPIEVSNPRLLLPIFSIFFFFLIIVLDINTRSTDSYPLLYR